MPKAPLEMASCTAVAISVGLVWSSRTMPESLWPLTPPSAFCRAMRALNPAGAGLNSEDPGPVSEVIMARVIGGPERRGTRGRTQRADDVDDAREQERRQCEPRDAT